MVDILLYCLAVFAGLVILMLVLPMKVFVRSAGGSEERLTVSGRIMTYAGLIGGGIEYRPDLYTVSVWILSWNAVSFDIKPSAKEEPEKPKKEKAGEISAEKEEKPFAERIRSWYDKTVKYKGLAGQTLSDLYKIFRIDRFSAYVRFGLGNPALTGKLIGIIFLVNGMLPKPFKITQSWDFTKTTLNGELDAKVTFFSHIFWITLIRRIPVIISIIREERREKSYSDNTLAIQEV